MINSILEVGWEAIRESSIQRIIYLAKVLYTFVLEEKELFEEYHFTTSLTGPYSDLIYNSILYLKSNENISETDGLITLEQDFNPGGVEFENERSEWIKSVIYILALYGEDKVFGFTINDPLYKDSLIRNEPKELDTSPDNVTIQVLYQFKEAFEETIDNTNHIDNKEYLELYFEYVFSKIIKKEN